MDVKQHYQTHLGKIYSWMVGQRDDSVNSFLDFLQTNRIDLKPNETAVDLGSGHGIQSIALAELGLHVLSIDFDPQLLEELKNHSLGKQINIVEGDIRDFSKYISEKVNCIVCFGDTILHLNSKEEVKHLLNDAYKNLLPDGKFLLSFRDYSKPVLGDDRFIPVRSDENRILTCVLDYEGNKIRVTDQLYERINSEWKMKVSSYDKVRILPDEMKDLMESVGFEIVLNKVFQRMIAIVAKRK